MTVSAKFDNTPQNQEWIDSITEEAALAGLTVTDAMMMKTYDSLDVPISGDMLKIIDAK